MFKKFIYVFALIALVGCKTTSGTKEKDIISAINKGSISEDNFGQATNFRVGMLLPLTGPAAKHGEGLRNAALLAIEDLDNPNMLIQFYDTRSTTSGSRIAIENALNQKSQMIIGPLMADDVKAISEQTLKKQIPVLTFSTSYDVLSEGVYSLGLLVGEQVDRIISHAAKNKRKKIALLIPDNLTGVSVAKAAIISATKNDMEIVRIGFYPPNTSNFSNILRELTDYDLRSGRVNKIKAKLQKQSDKGSEYADKVLKKLNNIDTLGEVDFDTILIPESGQRLKAAAAMLNFYDVTYPKVQILGTSVWGSSDISNEGSLRGAWYPTISETNDQYFIRKYMETFEEKPNGLYSFAYDALALASIVTKKKDPDIDGVITNFDGYIGVNGIFRIFPDGTNQHALDIVEVGKGEIKIIDKAPSRFDYHQEYIDFRFVKYDEDYRAPLIFGKDKINAQTLIYASELPEYNQPIEVEISEEEEESIIRKELLKHRIRIL